MAVYRTNRKVFRLPYRNTVIQAEVKAIRKSLKWLIVNMDPGKVNIFMPISQSASRTIESETITSKTV